MNTNLTDRGIKLLYRQRGSRSRKVTHESDDDKLIIKGPSTSEMELDSHQDSFENGQEPLFLEELEQEQGLEPEPDQGSDLEQDITVLRGETSKDNNMEVGSSPHKLDQKVSQNVSQEPEAEYDDDELLSYYNFQSMPLRQLSSSITSVTSIDVLISIFTNLFQNDLIPQATKEFEGSRDRHSKMMYKLDVRIFESLLDQLVKDFKDILDINMSNNELCYQLKQIAMAREDLNEQLVEVRKELQLLKCGGEWYQLQQEQLALNDRVKLNDELNALSDKLLDQNFRAENEEPLSLSEPVNEFCELVNPYNGILANIENINERLQQDPLIE